MKKIIAVLLCVMLLGTMCAAFAEEAVIAPAPKTVSFRVEGTDKNLYYNAKEAVLEGDTVLSVLERVLKAEEIAYTVKESVYGGMYVSAIGGVEEASFGGYDGWLFYVNGMDAPVTIDSYKLEGGEDVVVAYCDPYGMPATVLPKVSTDKKDGIATVTVTADVTSYDENWNPIVSTVAVDGAKLTVDGTAYVTDENGTVKLSAEASAKETVSFQIEKMTEDGKPLVLRFAPDYEISLKAKPVVFSDVAEGIWYAPAVYDMAAKGLVKGMPDGTFAPGKAITRAEIVTILWRAAGEKVVNYAMSFSDVEEDIWYAEAVRWAEALGVVQGSNGKFAPGANITRQDLAVMLTRFNEKVLKKELPADQPAPAFADNAEIAAYAAESVYQLQKAGIVNGVDGSFLPRNTASRAEACKMMASFVA